MNVALALAVAGLAFRAASVWSTVARRADGDVDVVGLKDAAEIGLVRRAAAQALERGVLVPEGFEEANGKFLPVEGLLGQFGNGLFDLNGVHVSVPEDWPEQADVLRRVGEFSEVWDDESDLGARLSVCGIIDLLRERATPEFTQMLIGVLPLSDGTLLGRFEAFCTWAVGPGSLVCNAPQTYAQSSWGTSAPLGRQVPKPGFPDHEFRLLSRPYQAFTPSRFFPLNTSTERPEVRYHVSQISFPPSSFVQTRQNLSPRISQVPMI